ncbi:MAG: hypothetical protein JSW61_10045 [Candidatus Thorarchaeota archaeon]|nr:MAG: hypothetical protein JSW61_10045 [Candidatus Thorarchaeota archaeon]
MTEIPMADPGVAAGERPREVTYAAFIVFLDAIAGLVSGAISYMIWEDWTAGIGVILALIAFWLYFQILKQDNQAWTLAVIFNIAAIFLYASGGIVNNSAGILLSIISVIYLNLPDVRKHFQ